MPPQETSPQFPKFEPVFKVVESTRAEIQDYINSSIHRDFMTFVSSRLKNLQATLEDPSIGIEATNFIRGQVSVLRRLGEEDIFVQTLLLVTEKKKDARIE